MLLRALGARSRDVIFRYRLLPTPAFEYLSPSVEALTGYTVDEFVADPSLFRALVHPEDLHLVTEGTDAEAGATVRWIRRDGRQIWVEDRNVLVRGSTGNVVAVEGIARDVTGQILATAALKESELRFRTLMDVIRVPAIMLDPAGRATFVNERFLDTTGWTRAEVLGVDWFDNFVPADEREVRRQQFQQGLLHGFPLHPATSNVLARDGSLRHLAISTAVLHDAAGRVTGVVAIGGDVTMLQSVELERDRLGVGLREAEVLARSAARQRVEMVRALQGMGTLGTFQQTAQAMCSEMVTITGVDFASIDAFEGSSRLRVVAACGSAVTPGQHIPRQRATELWARASRGAWTEAYGTPDNPFGRRVARSGEQAVAVSPILTERGLVGLLFLGTRSPEYAGHLVELLPAAVEFAAIAGSVLGPGLEARRDEVSVHARIEQVIRAQAFRPVFQPVVDLATLEPIGYEALTRFTSRQRPDHVFASAQRTGLGLQLEFATLTAALKDALRLPAGLWLSLNVSPACVMAHEDLARILKARTRPVILEITEHEKISDYAALREAIVSLGADVRVAVDDAGAGVANFRHLVELRPDFVKIDAALVKNVNTDLTRQALVVGLCHFAEATGNSVIAEGVETQGELATLRGLDVRFAQGFLLGRPLPVDEVLRQRLPRSATDASTPAKAAGLAPYRAPGG